MEKSMIVLFVGLIAHVNFPDWQVQSTGVLLRAPGHEATLTIPDTATVRPLNPGDTWIDQYKQSGGGYRVHLDDMHVRLEGTQSVATQKTAAQKRHVPNLGTIAPNCKKLNPAVRARRPDADFAAFFDYRGGTLTPLNYLREMLGFPGTKEADPRCVACYDRLDTALTGPEALLVFSPSGGATHSYWVSPTTLVVANRHPAGGSHFDLYYKVLQSCPPVSPVADGPCTMERCAEVEAMVPDSDCSNSQWP
ncbi:MAG TPA: hypothetical protein VNL91_11645 [Thermoanaerobaculia bacterium]|nr:hypothetical protein [Thermoanaerobaculia bacterium]